MSNSWTEFCKTYKNNNKKLKNVIHLQTDYERARFLQNLLIDRATGRSSNDSNDDYEVLRSYFLLHEDIKNIIPSCLRTNRDLSQFWQFIKPLFPTYAERKEFIWDEFTNIFAHLESGVSSPVESNIDERLSKFDIENIHRYWKKGLDRKNHDQDGALTMARTLLESVCKHILDLQEIEYDPKIELPDLCKKTFFSLNLHPNQHEEILFKQILGGCSAIVNGLGSLRNSLGDAHGITTKMINRKPSNRHAELAVNLAGAMTSFLIQTFEHRGKKVPPDPKTTT